MECIQNPELCISHIILACQRRLDILIALPQSYHQYFELCFRFFHLVSEKSYWDIKLRWTCLRAQSQNTNQGAVPLPNDTMNHVSRNLFYQNFLFGKEQEKFCSQHTISLRWNLSRVSSKVDSYRMKISYIYKSQVYCRMSVAEDSCNLAHIQILSI